MKKLIILTLTLALMMATASFASQTRVLTMGDNNTILVDDANIWLWPSRLNNYPQLAIGEFGSSSFYSASEDFSRFGVHWQFGGDQPWVLATYFENNSDFEPFFQYPANLFDGYYPGSFLGTNPTNRRIHAFYANSLGGNKFGARLSLYKNGYEEPNGFKEGFSYFEGSLGLTSGADDWDLALTAGFGTWTDEDNAVVYSEPDGLVDLQVLGRMFWTGTPFTYVPHASIEYHKQGENYFYFTGASVEVYKYTDMAVDLGIGQTYAPSANVEAVIDVGLRIDRYKLEYTDVAVAANSFEDKVNFTSAPYFKLGLDAEVFSWLDARFGATSFWQWGKYESSGTTTFKENYADNNTFLGLGFHWGNLHVDTYTDPEIFLTGFDFISGDGSTEMNFQMSAVYDLM